MNIERMRTAALRKLALKAEVDEWSSERILEELDKLESEEDAYWDRRFEEARDREDEARFAD